MAKIKINSLPPGFKIVDGKIVEDQMMREGGYVTGDQAGYGLVTLPQEYYNNANMNTTRDESVRYSLSSVPRDKANIEAEGGETVLTDLNNDNQFGLYNIRGPRHSKGGVPMYLPEQSFIYSDTDKMRFDQTEMAEYGIESKSKLTPAQISKKYDLNKYYGAMKDQFADEITARSSELMLKKNMMGLSKLAFGQELKKKFEDGVPLAAHPYLVSIGEDPIEFTAKVENITRKQAQMKAFAALPPDQQEQLLQLQEMMAQVDQQQPQQQEQFFEDPSMQDPSMGQQQLAMADEDVMNMPNEDIYEDDMARYGREIAKYQVGKEKPVNPLPKDHPQYAEAQEMIDSGKYEIIKGDIVNGKQQYNFKELVREDPKFTKARNTQLNKKITTATNQKGTGSVPIYDETLSGQAQAFKENEKGIFYYGNLSGENRPLLQSTIYNNQIVNGVYDPSIQADRNSGAYAYGSPDIKTAESKADFMDRWGDVVATIPGFDFNKNANDPQWGQFQKKAEEINKNKYKEIFGNLDGYKSYYKEKSDKDYIQGEGYDSALGLRTFNTPRFTVNEYKPIDKTFAVDIPAKEKTIEIPGINKYTPPQGRFWAQDINNLNALGLIDDNLYLPWAPDAGPAKIDYVLDDWRGRANAALASQNTIAGALGAAGGPQAVASSNIQGTAMDNIAQGINRVNMNNVGIMNQVAPMQAQLDMGIDALNQARNIKVYDDTQKTLQAADNFKNWKIGKNAELENTALTNRANTYNLNTLYENYAIDPTTGGPIAFKGNKAFQKVGKEPDKQKAFLDAYTELRKNLPADQKIDESFLKMYLGMSPNQNPDITNAQLEMQRNGVPMGYPTSQGKSGKEIKKMIVPFYTGKMGA
jgi:hypothetical protein